MGCHSTAICSSGQCTCANTSQSLCPRVGCVDLNNDHLNCGTCNQQCGINSICQNGKCQCANNYLSCDATFKGGCEVNRLVNVSINNTIINIEHVTVQLRKIIAMPFAHVLALICCIYICTGHQLWFVWYNMFSSKCNQQLYKWCLYNILMCKRLR
jgi:hypothetical protein